MTEPTKLEVINAFKDIQNNPEYSQPWRYWLYGHLYGGDQVVNKELKCFILLVNRLMLTNLGMFAGFADAISQEKNGHKVLLDDFLLIQDAVNTELHNNMCKKIKYFVEHKASLLMKRDGGPDAGNPFNIFLEKVLQYSVPRDKENDAYCAVYAEIVKLRVERGLEDVVGQRYISELIKLRDEYQQNKDELYSALKKLKVDINHYLVFSDGDQRINNAEKNSDTEMDSSAAGASRYSVVSMNGDEINKKKSEYAVKQTIEAVATLVARFGRIW